MLSELLGEVLLLCSGINVSIRDLGIGERSELLGVVRGILLFFSDGDVRLW